MLSPEDNERLTRVSRGTPMGELMRRYWQPILLSSEVPEPDGAPVRVRVLGESLVAFRDTSGRVGLIDAYCPHRRAPLFFGRNEECGLRCVYHGWKFDADGNCVDLPTEPSSSNMKNHIKITAYPTYEKAGVIWTYMGPQDQRPEPPDYEWMRAPDTHRHVSKTYEHCNWLQALEGGLDTAHSSYLHNQNIKSKNELRQRDGAPVLDVERTDYGYTYISHRKAGEDGTYVRVYQYVMPWQQMRGGVQKLKARHAYPKIDGHIWVPIDDEHSLIWGIRWNPTKEMQARDLLTKSARQGVGLMRTGANERFYAGWWPEANLDNDYLIDRESQRTQTFTGIPTIRLQDAAMTASMGPVFDRSAEHLGTTDAAIIKGRQRLLRAAKALRSDGTLPPGVDQPELFTVRSCSAVLPEGVDWRTALEDWHLARTDEVSAAQELAARR